MADTPAEARGGSVTYQAKPALLGLHENRRLRGGYGLAIASILTAFLVRWSLNVYLQEDLPYAIFLIAVMVTAWYSGIGASLVAVLLGGVIGNWVLVAPRFAFALTGLIDQAGLVIYLTVSFAAIGLIQTWRWAWRRTEQMAEELQDELKRRSNQPQEHPTTVVLTEKDPNPTCEP